MKKYLQILLFLLFSVLVSGQSNSKTEKQFEKAREYYSMQNMDDAIKEATKIVNKTPDFVNASLLLADIYHELDSSFFEIKYLEQALKYTDKPVVLYRLGEAYYSIGNYEQAKNNYQLYLKNGRVAATRKAEVHRKIESCEFAVEAIKHPVEFNPIRLSNSVNSVNDEYWPSISLDQEELVFTRLMKIAGQRPQEDFFISEYNLGKWGLAQPILEINTTQNEGAQSLSVNGKFLFFSACNRGDGFGSCDIYYSERINGKWSFPKNVGEPANSNAWESQPSFSSDNNFLYFSSNRNGGIGKKDIWRTEFQGISPGGKILWSQPENMGDNINTPGDEISPFIHANNKSFYFASNYRTGMGGFDLFRAEQKNNQTLTEAENLGFPINSLEDEQGLNISSDGITAFFSSARTAGMGLDIYTFELEENMRPEPVTYAKVKVTNAENNQPIQARIELMNLFNSGEKRSETANSRGEAMLCFPLGAKYAFNVSEKGFLFYSQSFELSDSKSIIKPYEIDIKLKAIQVGAEMNLYNIYFETDSFKILPESFPELKKLVSLLSINSNLKIEIQGHTDNSGNKEKNNQLSELRAKSVAGYLIQNGIEEYRLLSKGYGENQPVATNETKEGRKLNRRTTIRIIEK